MGIYPSDRVSKVTGLEAKHNPFHSPIRKVTDKVDSFLDFTPMQKTKKWDR